MQQVPMQQVPKQKDTMQLAVPMELVDSAVYPEIMWENGERYRNPEFLKNAVINYLKSQSPRAREANSAVSTQEIHQYLLNRTIQDPHISPVHVPSLLEDLVRERRLINVVRTIGAEPISCWYLYPYLLNDTNKGHDYIKYRILCFLKKYRFCTSNPWVSTNDLIGLVNGNQTYDSKYQQMCKDNWVFFISILFDIEEKDKLIDHTINNGITYWRLCK